jgi:hypothetical protein
VLETVAIKAAHGVLAKAASTAGSVITDAAKRALLGDAAARALWRAYVAGMNAAIAATTASLDRSRAAVVDDILRAFCRNEDVFALVAGAALAHDQPETLVTPLRARFLAHGNAFHLDADFDAFVLRLGKSVVDEVWIEASSASSPLASAAIIARIDAVTGQLRAGADERRRAALQRLRRASALAGSDANIVDETGDRVVMLQDGSGGVYVRRDIEDDIGEWIRGATPDEPLFLLIEGEAGHGKTSLLWHLYVTSVGRSDAEVWFVKPARIAISAAADYRLGAEELALAATAVLAESRVPFALFDTIDVLLHDERNADHLRDLFAVLLEKRCSVIATTRPAEARLLRGFEPRRITLRRYNDREAAEAVRTHVRTYYGDPDPEREDEQFTRIIGAVAAGLPLRDVCLNPLTLRMVFAVYAPYDVASEIDVLSLYGAYWERRVVSDLRPGAAVPASTRDLSAAAELLATVMLAEGTPDVSTAAVERVLARARLSMADITELASRGVVQSLPETTSFFHQTFFEHAAARMLVRAGAHALRALQERLEQRAFDPYIAPVFEQALLFGATDPLVSATTDDMLLALLAAGDVTALRSGLFVFAHRSLVPDAAVERVRAIVTAPASQDLGHITTEFFEYAANYPSGRFAELVMLLRESWAAHPVTTEESDDRSANWAVRQKIFTLIERLAPRIPRDVRDALEDLGILDFALSADPKLQPERELRNVIRALLPHESEWCWSVLVRLYNAAAPGRRPVGLRVAVLRVIAERASVLGHERLASRFEAALSDTGTEEEQAVDLDARADLYDAWATLWNIEWNDAAASVAEILAAFPEDEVRIRRRLRGLRDLLTRSSVDDLRRVWTFMRDDDVRVRRGMFALMLWTPFVEGKGTDEGCVFVVDELKAFFEALCGGTQSELAAPLRNVIKRADVPAAIFHQVFGSRCFDDAEPWLDAARTGELLGAGWNAGHAGAREAAKRVALEPQRFRSAAMVLMKSLVARPLDADAAHLFVRLAAACEAIERIGQIVHRGDIASTRELAADPDFLPFLAAMRRHAGENVRGSAIRVTEALVRSRIITPPPLDELLAALAAEPIAQNVGHLALLLAHGAASGAWDEAQTPRVIRAIEPLVVSKDQGIRDTASKALKIAVLEAPGGDAFVDAAFDLLMQPPADQGRLSDCVPLLHRMLARDQRHANRQLYALLASGAARDVGRNAKRTLANHLRRVARQIVATSTPEEREQLAALLLTADQFLARPIIEALAEHHFEDMLRSLDRVLETESVDPAVKLLIRDQKHHRQRVRGSARWPEVYALAGF